MRELLIKNRKIFLGYLQYGIIDQTVYSKFIDKQTSNVYADSKQIDRDSKLGEIFLAASDAVLSSSIWKTVIVTIPSR